MRTRLIAGSLFVILAASASWAQPLGTAFTYQGRLKSGGSPANGSFNMDFKLYPVAAGGTLLASQTLPGVSVTDGLFTVQIEFGAGVFDGNQRWLDVTVNGTPLVPRQELTAAPYALFTLNADRLDGLDSTAFLQSIPVPLTLSGTSATHIIRGENASTTGGATGVFGESTAVSGGTYGGQFRCASPDGAVGVAGQANSATGFTYGVVGINFSTSGEGVRGNALASSGITYGVRGLSASPAGTGVFGETTATSGINYGVHGKSISSSLGAAGVFGEATSPSGFGVWGENLSTLGIARGVYGKSGSTSGAGVEGYNTRTTGTNYGVFGATESMTSGFAVYANGRFGAAGTKSFRIDHPDDPENKYLLHYCTESPEVINFYRGTVVLDGAGEAVVELPHYFAKINRAPSYQLTAVGAPMPLLHVAAEIDEAALSAGAKAGPGEAAPVCSFRIAGGAPGKKVSWRVEALRNDKWIQRRAAPVEVEKDGTEKGTYQHPEFYGQPAEKGMNYDAARSERGARLEQSARE